MNSCSGYFAYWWIALTARVSFALLSPCNSFQRVNYEVRKLQQIFIKESTNIKVRENKITLFQTFWCT